MKFVIAEDRRPHFTQDQVYTVVDAHRQDLGEPQPLTYNELCQELQDGAIFHVLYQVRCRWEVGPRIQLNPAGKIELESDT